MATASAPPGTGAAGGGVGEVGGSACGTPHGPWDNSDAAPSGEVRAAFNQPAYSFNTSTTRGNSTYNANPQYFLFGGTSGGMAYYDQDLNYVNNDSFGTCTLKSLDPLTI